MTAEATLRRRLAAIEARLGDRLPHHPSDLHGMGHLREVAMLAGQLAMELGVDVDAAMVAGLLHDCGRQDDAGGNAHAHASAALARPLLDELFPELDAERICQAILRHADGLVSDDPFIGCVWDADRLTISRAGIRLNPAFLSTEAAKKLAHRR